MAQHVAEDAARRLREAGADAEAFAPDAHAQADPRDAGYVDTPCDLRLRSIRVDRRAAHAWSTAVVALAVMLAVPVAQLRFVYVENACCCPHTKRCHCPDHQDPARPARAGIRACHQAQQVIVTPPMPGFDPARGADLAAPDRILAVATFAIAQPHAPPSPRRPDAPS